MSTRIFGYLALTTIVFVAPRANAQESQSPADMKAMAAHMDISF